MTDLQVLHHERLKKNKNPTIGYLNMNSRWNKLTDLRVILKWLSLDYFVLSETKLDETLNFRTLNLPKTVTESE